MKALIIEIRAHHHDSLQFCTKLVSGFQYITTTGYEDWEMKNALFLFWSNHDYEITVNRYQVKYDQIDFLTW